MFPDGEVRLPPTDSATEMFQPITPWMSALEALTVMTVFVFLKQEVGNCQVRLGIQSRQHEAGTVNLSAVGSDSGLITVVGPASGKLYRFDPNAAANGNISGGTAFQIGILYSSTSAAAAQGSVRWEGMAWR